MFLLWALNTITFTAAMVCVWYCDIQVTGGKELSPPGRAAFTQVPPQWVFSALPVVRCVRPRLSKDLYAELTAGQEELPEFVLLPKVPVYHGRSLKRLPILKHKLVDLEKPCLRLDTTTALNLWHFGVDVHVDPREVKFGSPFIQLHC